MGRIRGLVCTPVKFNQVNFPVRGARPGRSCRFLAGRIASAKQLDIDCAQCEIFEPNSGLDLKKVLELDTLPGVAWLGGAGRVVLAPAPLRDRGLDTPAPNPLENCLD